MDRINAFLASRWGWLLVALVAVAVLIINPVGYIGGVQDDARYLTAARCWVEHAAPCLPTNHWAVRWPAVAPLALFTGLFGESRFTVGLGPLLGWLATIMLVGALASAWFDRRAGLIAAALIASLPTIALSAVQPSIDNIELAFQLAALLAATMAYRRQCRWTALAAGVLAGLAVASRDTGLLFCAAAAAGWLVLGREKRRVLLFAIPGLLGTLALEMLVYAAATGDAFFRYRLALAHTSLPSTELLGVDTAKSPLFNPEIIAAWHRDAGIHWYWPIDSWANLVASPFVRDLFIAAALLAPFGWRAMPKLWRWRLARVLGGAMMMAMGLVYALAIDPKPRMFLALEAAIVIALAAMVSALMGRGRGLVPLTLVVVVILMSGWRLSSAVNTQLVEERARQWIAAHPNDLAIDELPRSVLALVPEAQALPPPSANTRFRMSGTGEVCETFGLSIVDRVGERPGGELCLLSRVKAP